MNVMIAVAGVDPAVGGVGGGGSDVVAGLALFGLLLLVVAAASARRAPVFAVRHFSRRF
ncbi:MAG: hypothetical protein HKL90_15170 [Elusimicrobia bacterium]|nr:hypothetical protein [Elusimicrobiota bacterium]